MPPEVVDVLLQGRRDYLAFEASIMRDLARGWLQVESRLREDIEALADYLSQFPQPVPTWRLYQDRRFRQLIVQVSEELATYGINVSSVFSATMDRQIDAALGLSRVAMDAVGGEAGSAAINLAFDRINRRTVENAVFHARDLGPFSRLIDGAGLVGRERMAAELVTSLGLGKSPREAARRALRFGLGQSFTRYMTIFRTEMTRVQRHTSVETYRQTGLVRGYRRLSAKDRRSCIACILTDGMVFPLDHPFDAHPNCRCTLVPVLVDWNRSIPTGIQWFESQTQERQLALLGRDRFDMWQDGRPLLDFVMRHEHPVWGDAFLERPFWDLRGMSLPSVS